MAGKFGSCRGFRERAQESEREKGRRRGRERGEGV
jgi:hypothetical protein